MKKYNPEIFDDWSYDQQVTFNKWGFYYQSPYLGLDTQWDCKWLCEYYSYGIYLELPLPHTRLIRLGYRGAGYWIRLSGTCEYFETTDDIISFCKCVIDEVIAVRRIPR